MGLLGDYCAWIIKKPTKLFFPLEHNTPSPPKPGINTSQLGGYTYFGYLFSVKFRLISSYEVLAQ